MNVKTRIAALLAPSVVSFAAAAQVPATAPYNTDVPNMSVRDQTSQGIGSLNMVLCVIGAMDPSDMVNAGPYLALVDMNKCQSKNGQASGSSAGATNYANAIVNVTRASNNDPMRAKVWLSLTEQGATTNVYASLSATQAPSATAPYGIFRMDYIGKRNGQVGFNGYIDAQSASISFLETGPNSDNTALAMATNGTTAGSGTMQVGGGSSGMPQSTFNFAYNPSYFRRSDGTNDVCFARSQANAKTLVWQYGTYDATTGQRVDLPHPGIPLQAVSGGQTYYGFGNYWGINFQGLAIADGQPVAGITVTDQRPNVTATYQLNKVGGKLTKWTQQNAVLNALDGIPFNVGADLTGLTTGNAAATGWNTWVLQWSSASQAFSVVGTQSCSGNGCTTSSLNPAATLLPTAFATQPLQGWADSFGGNLNIPPTGSAHAPTDPVYYYTQSTVLPGSAPLTLYCLNQCPTAAQLLAFSQGNASTTPFGNGTDQQWFSAPSAAGTVTYAFTAAGLMESGSPVVLEQASQYPNGSPYAQNGISSGWLLDAPLTTANCPSGFPAGSVCEPANPTTYYTWQTGPQQWNQSLWLTLNGNAVPFDPPVNIPYTVPTGSPYGPYAGLPILLQFNGFGNLNGIPGFCVNPVNNSVVDCSTNGSNYMPLFSIPDGTQLTLPGTNATASRTLLVKALQGEILLAPSLGQCTSMALTPQALPSGGLHDPSSASDSEYLGAMPTVTAMPKVIDGALQ
ncbi:MAG TPA: hypothetical protein VMU33_08100 [Burkholderiaceae bacterium]|nr:hypothetical protein [Burkholderiaceae bacterium]